MASELITGLSIFKSMMDMAKGLKDISDASIRYTTAIERAANGADSTNRRA